MVVCDLFPAPLPPVFFFFGGRGPPEGAPPNFFLGGVLFFLGRGRVIVAAATGHGSHSSHVM